MQYEPAGWAAGEGIRGHGSEPGHTSTASTARARASAAHEQLMLIGIG